VILARLLGDYPGARFLGEFYHRLPYARPGGAAGLAPPLGWDRLRGLLESPGADVMLSRRGRPWEGKATPPFDEIRRLHSEGYTVTIRSAEKIDPDLGRLAEAFHADFRAPVNIHVYRTPSGEHGFGWHYDVEDVFVLQAEGSKEYSLRKNTVNPWPALETLPRDLRFEKEGSPVFTCLLEAGDWLYIPAGWWHIAKTSRESASLAVGLMSPMAMDLYRFLGARLIDSVIWRQRLPVTGSAGSVPAETLLDRYADLFNTLGRDVAERMSDRRTAQRYLESRGVNFNP